MLPDGDGIAMGAEIQRSRSGTRVLVLAAQAQESLCRRAQELGISAYVLKQQDVGELVEALDRLAAGESYAPDPSTFGPSTIVAGKTPVVGAPVDGLSKRQRQILALILARLTARRSPGFCSLV